MNAKRASLPALSFYILYIIIFIIIRTESINVRQVVIFSLFFLLSLKNYFKYSQNFVFFHRHRLRYP